MIKQTFQTKFTDLDLYKVSMDNVDQEALLVTIEGDDRMFIMLHNDFLEKFSETDNLSICYRTLSPNWGEGLSKAATHRYMYVPIGYMAETVNELKLARQFLAAKRNVIISTLTKKLELKEVYRFKVNGEAEVDVPRISRENPNTDVLIVDIQTTAPSKILMISNTLLSKLSQALIQPSATYPIPMNYSYGCDYVDCVNGHLAFGKGVNAKPIMSHRATFCSENKEIDQLREAIKAYREQVGVTINVHTL